MRIEEVLNKQGYVTNQNIQKTLEVPRFRAVRIAKRLIDLGLVELTGKGRGAKYVKKVESHSKNETS